MSVHRAFSDYSAALGYGPLPSQRERDSNLAKWGCLLLILGWPISLVLRGYVLQHLWLWFIVPFGIMAINLPHALGLSGLLYFFTLHSVGQQANDDELIGQKIGKAAWAMFGMPLMAWLFGWMWHSWM